MLDKGAHDRGLRRRSEPRYGNEYQRRLPTGSRHWENHFRARSNGSSERRPDGRQVERFALEAMFAEQDDKSLLVTGPNGLKGATRSRPEFDAQNVTGFPPRSLQDDRLPGKARGGHPTELRPHRADDRGVAEGSSEQKVKVDLQNARSARTSARAASRSRRRRRQHDRLGQRLGDPPGDGEDAHGDVRDQAAPLRPVCAAVHDGPAACADGMHSLGRFRLSTTTAQPPLIFGVRQHPEHRQRSGEAESQAEESIRRLLRKRRTPSRRRCRRRSTRKKPRALGSGCQVSFGGKTDVSQPLPIDPKFARLERASKAQRRAAQERPADRRAGYRLALDQQPGVPVQSVKRAG